jgi:Na+/H+ antiporter NhaD/arsenite permease-like protein
VTQPFTPHLIFGLDPMWTSAAILALTYVLVIAGRVNRAVVALIGAVIVIAIGALDQNAALSGINWDTIGLLTGMMILVSIARRSGKPPFTIPNYRSAQRAPRVGWVAAVTASAVCRRSPICAVSLTDSRRRLRRATVTR